MKLPLIICYALLTIVGSVTQAQELQQPLQDVPMSNKGFVLLKTNELLEGRIVNTSSTNGITQVTLELQDGEKRKFKSQEIEEFLVVMNNAVRLQFANEKGQSVKKILNRKQPSAVPTDYIIYRNVRQDNDKEILLQLLNPDFDEIFEVFYDPLARTTTALSGEHITWTGEQHRVFLIRKNGGDLLRVKKGSYKKDYFTLFGECKSMQASKKPNFEDLDDHIILYQECQDLVF